MSFYRHLLRALCFVLSLYLIGVEFGVDFSKYLDKTFTMDRSGLVDICEWSTSPNTVYEWKCSHTQLGDNVSSLRKIK